MNDKGAVAQWWPVPCPHCKQRLDNNCELCSGERVLYVDRARIDRWLKKQLKHLHDRRESNNE